MRKEYLISKLSMDAEGHLIDTVKISLVTDNSVGNFEIKDRNWLADQFNNDHIIRGLYKRANGVWSREKIFRVEGGYFKWGYSLPRNISKRNVFVSYYHNDDQEKRKEFGNLFKDLIIDQSVQLDDIDSENSDDYIHRLINEGFMKDATILAVLLGPKTKCRKHVDWEIAGALNKKVGERYAGLLGIRLPSHPDFGLGTDYDPDNYPIRLAANLDTGYAVLADWTENRKAMQDLIELAFSNRSQSQKIKNAGISRLGKNSCK
jgi:hypothetical protein